MPLHGKCTGVVPLHGDAGTVDSVIKAKKGRAWSPDPRSGFRGFLESPQEFHKEGLLLQVHIIIKRTIINHAHKYCLLHTYLFPMIYM